MGRNNWRLYVVIIMALLFVNAFTGLLEPRNAGGGSCGSVFMPTPADYSQGFETLPGPTFNSKKLECPNMIIRANIEVIASFLMVGVLGLGLLLSRSTERREQAISSVEHSHLPPPPTPTIE